MKIVVCIKQVPSTNRVQLHPETNTIIRDGRLSVTNPFDAHAIEEAVRIKELAGEGEVIALSMGIPETERLLRDAESGVLTVLFCYLIKNLQEPILLPHRIHYPWQFVNYCR